VTFGELVRTYRTTAGLTQEELSLGSGVSYETISELERGVRARPQRDTLTRLIAAFTLVGKGDILRLDVVARGAYNERRATGSYYTPDAVVERIVRAVVDPLCAGKSSADIARLKLVDPALGSGHFLVVTLGRLARHHARALKAEQFRPMPGENDDHYRARIEPHDNDVVVSARFLVDRCLYGVDLNPLAVELAKLALWLYTLAPNRALSFLDAHLKMGNSIIGASLDRLETLGGSAVVARARAAGQLGTFSLTFARVRDHLLEDLRRIAVMPSETVEEVRLKDEAYRRFQDETEPFRAVANLWLSRHVGVEVRDDEYEVALDSLGSAYASPPDPDPWALFSSTNVAFAASQEVAGADGFFHWEIEFPDVFYDRDDASGDPRTGFDGVIGNPPYINAIDRSSGLGEEESEYWRRTFESARDAFDIYIVFMEQALRLVRPDGLVGLITPNKYLSAPYAKSLREYLAARHTVLEIVDYSRMPVFDDASVYPVVSVIRRGRDRVPDTISVEQVTPDGTRRFAHPSSLLDVIPDHLWGFLLTEGSALLRKIIGASKELRTVARVNASTTAAESAEYSPYLHEDADALRDRWRMINTGLIDRYVTTWGYSPLTHKRKKYAHPVLPMDANAVSPERAAQYGTPKLIFAKLARRIEVFIDTEGAYASMDTNFALDKGEGTPSLLYVGAVCNARLLSWVYEQFFSALKLGGGYYQIQAPQLRMLPIKRIDATTPSAERARWAAKAIALYERGDARGVRGIVEDSLTAEPARADVVHDVLAHLAGNMAALSARRLAAVESFMTDLGGVLTPVAVARLGRLWTPARPPRGTQPDASAVLGDLATRALTLRQGIGTLDEKQWRWLVVKRLSRTPHLSSIVEAYRAHHQAIADADARLAATDRLIDQVVYRLYDLDDTEVAMIEGL